MNHLFGGVAAKQLPKEVQATPRTRLRVEGKKLETPFRLSGEPLAWCCAFFFYLSVTPFLFVFLYHRFPTTILSVVGLLALCSFIPLYFNKGDKVAREPVGPLLAASMLACTCLVFLGSMYLYWAHVQPMRSLIVQRDYHGVYPQMPSSVMGDAAFLQFVGNSTVDVSKTVTIKSLDAGLSTFCAAPILDPHNIGRVEFWAVGVDCCGKSDGDKFECDDAGVPGARNAYVMQNPTDALYNAIGKYIAPPIVQRGIFKQAIAKAERAKNLVSSEEPLFVRWTKLNKEDLITLGIIRITLCCIGNTVLSAVLALLLARLNHRFRNLRMEQNIEKLVDDITSSKIDASAKIDELLQHLDDDLVDDLNLIENLASPRLKRVPLSKVDTLVWGVIVPYVVMMLCVLMTTYSACWRNGHLIQAPFLTILGIFIVALLATPSRVVTGLFLLLVSTSGLYIGHKNYTSNMFHYCSTGDHRTYSNVPANASSAMYWDAGALEFGNKAFLSQNHSVGFLYKGTVYCAAPILSQGRECEEEAPKLSLSPNQEDAIMMVGAGPARPMSFLQRTARMQLTPDIDEDTTTGMTGVENPEDAIDSMTGVTVRGGEDAEDVIDKPVSGLVSALQTLVAEPTQCKMVSPKRVEFWAIGTNCCSSRKDFRCDGGKDANAHSGVLVRATGAEEQGDDRPQFFNAISQAVAAYDLPVPDRPVLMRWGKDPEAIKWDWAEAAAGVILITAMVGFLTLLAIGIGSFLWLKQMRQREQKEYREQQAREQQAQQQPASGNGGFFSRARATLRV